MKNGGWDAHDTAIVVIIGEQTSDVVLIRSRKTGLWRFPGDRIRSEDLAASRPYDYDAAAEHAVMRITKQRTGLIPKVQRVIKAQRPFGAIYGYAGLANFREFAPRDTENTKIFQFENVATLEMSPTQRAVFEHVVMWTRE